MLAVELNRANFEYDVHSLVKAFYPQESVKVLTPDTKNEKREEVLDAVHMRIELADKGAVLQMEDVYKRQCWAYVIP